jgi:glycosyltransferase involved in cell wall biosynthesis
MLTLSLIIPVYNEERHIGACLDAVAKQTMKPLEVIIVDNNCSDRTLEIAETYDFVTIIHENKQGRGYARTAGFNAAKGDILGRIDADSRIHPDWVEHTSKRFTDDGELSGLTGMACVPFIPYVTRLKSQLFARAYYWFAHASFNTITMWGANTAVRRSSWSRVSDSVCLDDRIVHEDQDLSLWIAADGGKIMQDNHMMITSDAQSYRYLPKLLHYTNLYLSTKKFHKNNGNLAKKQLRRLGFCHTLPGRLLSILPSLYMLFISIILFPLDYLLLRLPKKPKTLL